MDILNGSGQLSAFHQGQLLTEGLLLVREDVCDWINTLVGDAQAISGPELLERLQSGVLLCELAGSIDWHLRNGAEGPAKIAGRPVPKQWPTAPRADFKATPGSFHAKDNIALFLKWCRELGMPNTILFETRGLVDSVEEKNVVLALLHLGEFCAEWRPNMPLPQFAKFKLELTQGARNGPSSFGISHSRSTNQLDEAGDHCSSESGSLSARSDSITNKQCIKRDSTDAPQSTKPRTKPLTTPQAKCTSGRPNRPIIKEPGSKPDPSSVPKTSKFVKNVKTVKNGTRKISQQNMNRSKSRDDIVKLTEAPTKLHDESNVPNIDLKIKEITNRCRCQSKFVIERTMLQEGMYRIGNKNIFVRMFRDNIMLRVGGGWETLNEYLAKVDPCYRQNTDSSHTFPRRQSLGFNPPSSTHLVQRMFRKSSQCELTSVKRQVASTEKC